MSQAPESRREMLSIGAVDPVSGKMVPVQISHDRLVTVARRSLGHASEAAYIVPAILQNPVAIFEGLRWDEDEDPRGVGWRCYCGIPAFAYRTDGTERPAYPGQVYVVFVNQDKVAYNWRWEMADPNAPGLPMNHQARFTKRPL
jgi:hypothetical protein